MVGHVGMRKLSACLEVGRERKAAIRPGIDEEGSRRESGLRASSLRLASRGFCSVVLCQALRRLISASRVITLLDGGVALWKGGREKEEWQISRKRATLWSP